MAGETTDDEKENLGSGEDGELETEEEDESEEESEGDESEAAGEDEEESEGEQEPEAPEKPAPVERDGIKRLEGETDREYGQRLEITKLRRENRDLKSGDMFQKPATAPVKKELSAESKAKLEKYKPEEVEALKDVLPAIAEELGFVRADDLATKNYMDEGNAQLASFLEAHPEYKPENDPQGLRWGQFNEEFGMYQRPANPKDLKKIFDRIHTTLSGVKPIGEKTGTVKAAQKKASSASHSGASAPQRTSSRPKSSSGLRTDALQGFTEEEIAEIEGRA